MNRQNSPKWSYDELVAFVLLYAAASDFVITAEERQLVRERIGPQHYRQLLRIFEETSDYDQLQLILSFRDQYFPDATRKEALLTNIQRTFLADHELHVLEQNLFRMLRKLL